MEGKGRRNWLRAAVGVPLLALTAASWRGVLAEKTTPKLPKPPSTTSEDGVAIAQDAEEARRILNEGFAGFIWVREFCTFEFDHLSRVSNGKVSGMLIDGYLDKQIALSTKINPKPSTILVVSDGTEKGDQKAGFIKKAFDKVGIRSFIAPTDPMPYFLVTINARLNEAQAVMMTPIQSIFKSDQMKLWLLMSIHQQIPLIGAWRDYQIQYGALSGYVYGEEEVDRVQSLALGDLKKNSAWPDTAYKPKVHLATNDKIAKYYAITVEE
jgi:hypothetical protein